MLLAAAGALHTVVNSRLLRTPATDPALSQVSVAVLVPARDEAAQVHQCLDRLRSQARVPRLQILVHDDCSSDGTAAIVAGIATKDERVRLLIGAEPPAGWLGKPHACSQLAARCREADVLVFVDADVLLEPLAIARAVDTLLSLDVDLLCPFPLQLADTWAERLVQPLLAWSWLTFVPLRASERSNRPSLVVACGQFLVVRRIAYDRAGGHSAVRAAVMEDLALARNVRRTGGRTAVVNGAGLARCRMYQGAGEVREGYTKSLWAAFGSPAGAVVVIAALTTVYVVPALAALTGSRSGLVGYLLGVAGRAVSANRTGSQVWPDALAHPVSVAAAAWLTLRSLSRRRKGLLVWKGRPV